MRRWPLPLAGLIVVISLLAACAPIPGITASPLGSAINVGAVLSLTGSQAESGQMAKEGYLFCQDWINAKGGVILRGAGHRLNIDITDDQSRPSIAAAVTEQLISQNHDTLLLGPSNDATAARAAPVAEQHQVPMVSNGASSDTIFNNHYHYLFSVLAPDSRQLQGVIDMALAQNPKPVSMAILAASDSLSAEVANATVIYAQAKGLNVLYGASYTSGVNDLSGVLGAAAGASPDLLLEAGHPAESVRTIQQALQMKVQPKLLAFSDGPGNPQFTQDLQAAANYSVGTTQWAPSTRNRTSYFIDSFHYSLAFAGQFGHIPDQHAAAATAACLTLEVAIEQANSTQPRWVRDALAITDLNTFFGEIKFDDRGANAVKPVYVEQVQAGRAVLIWPPEVATARPRYPDPGWAKR
ncbi:MAG TPA: amino acid ABC transporter substrate-binding protein [Candidatus Dormibacteraeota bacterium]|nr:amino acid ABC transporter substrate-binding protein [Candidatus Dormibacteraeota bacterium]